MVVTESAGSRLRLRAALAQSGYLGGLIAEDYPIWTADGTATVDFAAFTTESQHDVTTAAAIAVAADSLKPLVVASRRLPTHSQPRRCLSHCQTSWSCLVEILVRSHAANLRS